MPGEAPDNIGQVPKGEWFAQTSWTTIYSAKQGDPSKAREALEQLCQSYWYPLYAYIRRLQYSPHDAEDLTQAFFHHLLERDFLDGVDRSKGKFRSFLLVALKRFLESERRFRSAAKRGGGKAVLSLDEESAEGRYVLEPASDVSPDVIYEQAWAATLLEQVHTRLRQEYQAAGKLPVFERLKTFLTEESELGSYNALAAELGMTANAVGVTVYRLRHRYRELIRLEIAETVASPEEIGEEMRHLLQLLGKA